MEEINTKNMAQMPYDSARRQGEDNKNYSDVKAWMLGNWPCC